MKVIYYRTLIKIGKNITPEERILYSFLVSKSITYCNDFFNSDGTTINQDILSDSINYDHWLDMASINNTKIANELCITRQSVINAKQSLIEKNYIKCVSDERWFVYVNKELLENGYFELRGKENLKGDLLIFYSFLLDKSERFCYKATKKCDYRIDTYKDKIAEEIGKTKIAVTKLLNRLYRIGYAKRLKNGKLQLYLTPQENE